MIHQFGNLQIDTNMLVVSRDGSPVPLTPRPFALLEFLINHRDRIVSKEEVIEAVWDGRAISDATFTSAVRDLRKAIGDAGREDGLIRTFYGRGVRFVAPEEDAAGEVENTGSVSVEPGYPCVLAVLPFENLSSDGGLSSIADGLADEVIAQVSRFGLIRVLARNSSFSIKGLGLTAKQIGQKIGSHYLIEGTVRPLGSGLRVTIGLIESQSETQIWSESYEVSAYSLFDDQVNITTAVATCVVTRIYENEHRLASGKAANDLSAWENYCCGYGLFTSLAPAKQEAAIEFLERAIAQMPRFAEAYATLAYAICIQLLDTDHAIDDAEALRLRLVAHDHAQKALEIDARVPFAWVALARTKFALNEVDEAIAALKKATELNPNLGWSHCVLGMLYLQINRPGEAIDAFDRATLTSPQDSLQVITLGGHALAAVLLDKFDKAVELSRKAQLLPDAGLTAHLGEVCALGHLGKTKEASDAILRARRACRDFGILSIRKQFPLQDERARKQILDGLRMAGLDIGHGDQFD
ncbi:MAG: winged helix-turn-helix domain-containing protein [Pseudomonadota bacterium]